MVPCVQNQKTGFRERERRENNQVKKQRNAAIRRPNLLHTHALQQRVIPDDAACEGTLHNLQRPKSPKRAGYRNLDSSMKQQRSHQELRLACVWVSAGKKQQIVETLHFARTNRHAPLIRVEGGRGIFNR